MARPGGELGRDPESFFGGLGETVHRPGSQETGRWSAPVDDINRDE